MACRTIRKRTEGLGGFEVQRSTFNDRTLNFEQHSKSASSAFTLMELMVVIGIIVGLTSAIIGVKAYVDRSSTEALIQAQISTIENALEAYKNDNGAYPPLDSLAMNGTPSSKGYINTNSFPNGPTGVKLAEGWYNSQYLYRALMNTNDTNQKQYISLPPKQIQAVPASSELASIPIILVDPLGNPFGYRPSGPVYNPNTFDLWSAGYDRISNYPTNSPSSDDMTNWKRP